MSNTLSDAITKITALASLTTNTSNASATVKINQHIERQVSRERKIADFLTYGDHIGWVNPSDDTFYLYDKLRTGTATALNNYEIISIKANRQSGYYSKLTATFTRKDLSRSNNRPQLNESEITLSQTTGTGGEVQEIKIESEATTLSGSSIVYYYTDVTNVLTRKVNAYNKADIEIVINTFEAPQIGELISFDNTHDMDKYALIGSGSMVVTEVSYNTKELTTTLKGLGSFIES